MKKIYEPVNRVEHDSFWKTAFSIKGSATPLVLTRVGVFMLYGLFLCSVLTDMPFLWMDITPFEYSGAVLAVLLVWRINAGHDRWWEARKVWGSIVNQSRNLAIICQFYGPQSKKLKAELIDWISIWPYTMKEALRKTKDIPHLSKLYPDYKSNPITKSDHMPNYVGSKIAQLLQRAQDSGMDGFAFHRADKERSLMIDNIGKCERILNTPMPFVLAIKVRRFIVTFLILLPFGLFAKIGWFTPYCDSSRGLSSPIFR